MNFIEYHERITRALPNLTLKTSYISGNPDFQYDATELTKLKQAINAIEDVPFIQNEISRLKKSWLFLSSSDSQKINSTQNGEVDNAVKLISIKLNTFKEIAESSKLFNTNETLLIRIPEIQSFDNLAKYANDFKKAIELPILDESINGEVNILSANEGSIIFYISVGTIAAVKLIAGICWAAGVIKKKNAEAKIFEQHAKTLELKNESLSTFVEAQKTQLKNILEAEANAIANKIYNHNEPETIERLKLSISTVADLIDKGVQILPVSKDEEIQKSFPDYNKMSLIESSIKQISPEN
jgi:hypothetical protein